MPNPQNPELRRSEESLRPRPELGPDPQDVGGEGGPVPPDNQPGHHPPEDQDKPPADKFAEALGIKPDTEQSESPARSRRRAAKKATARKAAAKRTGPGDAAPAAPARGQARKAAKPAAETPVSPIAEEPVPSPSAATGAPPVAAAPPVAPAAPVAADEPAEQAARQHHHALPDDQLPHDAGVVTPSGTPVTTKVLTLPLRYWGAVFKVGGGAITAYGRMVKRVGERIVSGRR